MLAGCTPGAGQSFHGPMPPTTRADSVVTTCTQNDVGQTGRPGKFVYLTAPSTTVQTQRGFEVVVHPARGDNHGKRWRLVVTSGSSHLCRLSGRFVPSVIAAFIVQSSGTATLQATGPEGARQLTITARG